MPKRTPHTANKLYSDVVYAWLQLHSQHEAGTDIRWINKKDVNFTLMAEQLGLTRQSVAKKFKNLLCVKDEDKITRKPEEIDKLPEDMKGLGLISYNRNLKRYEILTLNSKLAMLIEKETLRKMLSTFNENTISAFIYFLNRFLANKEQPYEFTIEQVKVFIGIGVRSRSNNYIVTDIMSILKKLGLIKYELVSVDRRDHYRMLEVYSSIKC